MEYSRPEGALSADPTLWLYTSLSSGSSTIVTATARMETILKANRVPFKALDVATEEKARMLWGRRAGKRKLPGLVKMGMVLADLAEVEEWNEYGEVRENLLDEDEKPTPATPAAAPPRPAAPTPFTATTHNVIGGNAPPAATPIKFSAADLKSGASSLKSADTGRASLDSTSSAKNPEAERQNAMLSLAEQVAARAKKSSLRQPDGTVLTRQSLESTTSKTSLDKASEETKGGDAVKSQTKEPEADSTPASKETAADVQSKATIAEASSEGAKKGETATTSKEEIVKGDAPTLDKGQTGDAAVSGKADKDLSDEEESDENEDESEEDSDEESDEDDASAPAKGIDAANAKKDLPLRTPVPAAVAAAAASSAAKVTSQDKAEQPAKDSSSSSSEEDEEDDEKEEKSEKTEKTQDQGAADPKDAIKSVAD